MKSLKEIEYLYNNMTTSETIRLKPHLEVIEKELLELLPEREDTTRKLKALEIIKRYVQLEDDKVYTTGWAWNLTPEEYDLLKEVLK